MFGNKKRNSACKRHWSHLQKGSTEISTRSTFVLICRSEHIVYVKYSAWQRILLNQQITSVVRQNGFFYGSIIIWQHVWYNPYWTRGVKHYAPFSTGHDLHMSRTMTKGGLNESSERITPSMLSSNYGSIKIHFIKQPIESWGFRVLWHAENLHMTKSFDPCQPAQSAQADMSRYFT